MPAKIILNNEFEISLRADNANEIDLDYSAGEYGSAFQTPNLRFVRNFLAEFWATGKENDPVRYIQKFWKEKGVLTVLSAKVVTEGITVIDGEVNIFDKDNYINTQNTTSNTSLYKLSIVEKRKTLTEKLQGLSLQSLWEKEIQKSDCDEVGTVLHDVPDNKAAFMTSIALAVTTMSTIQSVQTTIKAVAKAIATAAYLNAAGGAVAWAVIEAVVALAINVAYTIALKKLTEQLYDDLINDLRYYNSISTIKILKAIYSRVGYEFNSEFMSNDFINLNIIANTDNSGTTSKGSANNNPIPDKSAMDFITDIATQFNATNKVSDNNTVIFERKDTFFEGVNSDVTILGLKKNGNFWGNFDELLSSINIKYQKDTTDSNTTADIKRAVNYNYLIKPSSNSNKNSFSKVKEVSIPYARCKRKDELSRVEEIYKEISSVAGNFGIDMQNIGDRIGAIRVENFNFGFDRMFMYENNGVSATDETKIDPETIYEKYHFIDAPTVNQWLIYNEIPSEPLSNKQFIDIKNNNIAKDMNGDSILIQANIRDSQTNTNTITYRRRTPSDHTLYINPNLILTVKTLPLA